MATNESTATLNVITEYQTRRESQIIGFDELSSTKGK